MPPQTQRPLILFHGGNGGRTGMWKHISKLGMNKPLSQYWNVANLHENQVLSFCGVLGSNPKQNLLRNKFKFIKWVVLSGKCS